MSYGNKGSRRRDARKRDEGKQGVRKRKQQAPAPADLRPDVGQVRELAPGEAEPGQAQVGPGGSAEVRRPASPLGGEGGRGRGPVRRRGV
jgi:hypothetical protein